jgi:hypothetical protein
MECGLRSSTSKGSYPQHSSFLSLVFEFRGWIAEEDPVFRTSSSSVAACPCCSLADRQILLVEKEPDELCIHNMLLIWVRRARGSPDRQGSSRLGFHQNFCQALGPEVMEAAVQTGHIDKERQIGAIGKAWDIIRR